MKITRYNLFESKSNNPYLSYKEKEDIRDICVGLNDLGLYVEIKDSSIRITRDLKLVSNDGDGYIILTSDIISELINVIKRLDTYLDRSYYEVSFVLYGEHRIRHLNLDRLESLIFLVYSGDNQNSRRDDATENMLVGVGHVVRRIDIDI